MRTDGSPAASKHGILKRLVGVSTAISAVCCVALLILLPLSLILELPDFDSDGNLEPNDTVSIGYVRCAAAGGTLWLFTDELPYRGSIMGLEGSWDGVAVRKRRDWGWQNGRYCIEQESYIDQTGNSAGKARFGDFPGIYYRHFEWRSSQSPWWTLAISLLYPIALTAMLPSAWIINKFKANLRFKLRTLLVAIAFFALLLTVALWVKR